ncbi:hypothetical protein NMYAN_10331 [Nitrosomonas nitrosa]|uniref:Uncharacterized protein n=1 Tax=Nitrosomonas nitrosa TaxID=52442 RepID=A0A8H8YXK0_9PROT|nr:hypothetical protein NMYAN_10331 [Nitrosomonas nitrosa]
MRHLYFSFAEYWGKSETPLLSQALHYYFKYISMLKLY